MYYSVLISETQNSALFPLSKSPTPPLAPATELKESVRMGVTCKYWFHDHAPAWLSFFCMFGLMEPSTC